MNILCNVVFHEYHRLHVFPIYQTLKGEANIFKEGVEVIFVYLALHNHMLYGSHFSSVYAVSSD